MARKYSEEEAKARLIRAVYQLAAAEGIEKVTMRKVAEGVDSPPRTFTSATEICLHL